MLFVDAVRDRVTAVSAVRVSVGVRVAVSPVR
jgi:hypothetical protein